MLLCCLMLATAAGKRTPLLHLTREAGLQLSSDWDALHLDAQSRLLSTRFTEMLSEEGLLDIVNNNSMGFWAAIRGPKLAVAGQVGYREAPSSASPKGVQARPTDVVPSGSL